MRPGNRQILTALEETAGYLLQADDALRRAGFRRGVRDHLMAALSAVEAELTLLDSVAESEALDALVDCGGD